MKFLYSAITLLSVFLAVCLFSPKTAMCQSKSVEEWKKVTSTKDWRSGMDKIKEQIEAKNFDGALQTSESLFSICRDDPLLYLYTGIAVRGTGDIPRALKYFIKASEFAAEKPLNYRDAQLIWNTLYETENPDSAPQAVSALQDELKGVKSELEILKNQNQSSEAILRSTLGIDIVETYKIITWTGVAAAGAGLAMIIGGTVGAATQNPAYIKRSESKEEYYIYSQYVTAWTFLGIGIGFTAIGTILAGYGGYYLAKINKANSSESDNYAIALAPGGVSFSMSF
jgi:hypothetical protein